MEGRAELPFTPTEKTMNHNPLDPLTPEEFSATVKAVVDAVAQHLGTSPDRCPVGSNGKYPVCNICWRLHMAAGADPWCVDHG